MTASRLGHFLVLFLACSALSLPAFAQASATGKDVKPFATKAADLIDINSAPADKLKTLLLTSNLRCYASSLCKLIVQDKLGVSVIVAYTTTMQESRLS